MNLYDQLYHGIRYIDFRVTYDEKQKTFRTLHFLMGNEVTVLLGDIRKFLLDFPTEVCYLRKDSAIDD